MEPVDGCFRRCCVNRSPAPEELRAEALRRDGPKRPSRHGLCEFGEDYAARKRNCFRSIPLIGESPRALLRVDGPRVRWHSPY